ncbi:MAG TPA: protein-tyrosine-phosphatase [Ohtaekwangia sp.]|uniref:protein-tyrosine-phosphatase n=1 Tax=Ohtaekwangia sp. TaxID=2066019 RepID=UPI002F95256F
MSLASEKKIILYPTLAQYIEKIAAEYTLIPEARKQVLKKLARVVEKNITAGKKAELIFICTHNSRRSHISQLWAQAIADYFQLPGIASYSGGTEATAFNPRAVRAMQEAGFAIDAVTEGDNPVYEVRYAEDASMMRVYSKTFYAPGNPAKDFCAVMTCTHADANCPIVEGASSRISLPFDDPKDFDGTPMESEKYSERARQIGRELLYAFSQVRR